MATREELVFITSNSNKATEVATMLGSTVSLRNRSLDLVEIQGSIEDISIDKCRRAADMVTSNAQGPVLVEDTALCFASLNGLPGPYVKWFLEALGPDGLTTLLAAYEDKSAQAVCTFAYGEPGKEPLCFQGRTDGKIVAPRGSGTFGWDPCFEYRGRTFAEMGKAEKNAISHRFKAIEKLRNWLDAQGGTQS